MRDALPLIRPHVSDEELAEITKAVSSAYKACHDCMDAYDALGGFLPGQLMGARIISPMVDYALAKLKFSHHSFTANLRGNWWQTKHHIGGITLTSHFLGSGKSRRTTARKALVRSGLNSRNGDLFAGMAQSEPELSASSTLYAHLLHAGFQDLEDLTIAVPFSQQDGYFAAHSLPVIGPTRAEVEEIKENLMVRLSEGLITHAEDQGQSG